MDIRAMLEQVQAGEMPIAQAEQMLKDLPYEDLGFAKLDHHRKLLVGVRGSGVLRRETG